MYTYTACTGSNIRCHIIKNFYENSTRIIIKRALQRFFGTSLTIYLIIAIKTGDNRTRTKNDQSVEMYWKM